MTKDTFRILTPLEVKDFLSGIPKLDNRFKVEVMLNTGMRYTEVEAFGEFDRWFDPLNRVIVLPASFTKTARTRTIHLTPQFSEKLEMFLHKGKLDFPNKATMNENLARWYGKEDPPTCKTFRKTWESWLLFAGYEPLKVALSQGHTTSIQLEHYANLTARLKSEAEAVKEYTKGWFT